MEPNYVQKVIDALTIELPDCDPELINLYTLVALAWGAFTSKQEVHDAWAVWRNLTNPDHKSLIPYNDLSYEVRDLDEKHAEGIRKVSRELYL